MLKVKPTEHLTGITIQGDFRDFYDLVDSMHRMGGWEETSEDPYYGVKNRLLGICYDVRHAFMGDRDVALVDNGMNQDIMKWQNTITPLQNVYYGFHVLFPEALFVAAAAPQIYGFSSRGYGSRGRRAESDLPVFSYADYLRDRANIDVLCAGIWQALGQVIGDEELEKVIHLKNRAYEDYTNYTTHYIDKCNIELLKTEEAKRKDKIRNIAKRIVKKPQAYYKLETDLRYWARKYQTTIYELKDPKHEYPEEIEW